MLTIDRTVGRRFRECGPTLRVTVQPELEPVTVAQAKRAAEVDDQGERDDLFAVWIQQARELVEQDLRRSILTQTRKLYLDRFPDGAIELECPPIQSVTSVQYYDTSGTLQTWSSANWSADTNSEPGYVLPVYGQSWPDTLPEKKGAVIVTFVAGWADVAQVPATIRSVILSLVADRYRDREGFGSKVGDYEVILRRWKWGPDA